VDLAVEASSEHAGILLEPDTRHHLYMMMKELVNNALRHSGCRSVRVGVGREGDALAVTVEDDGRGFDPGGMKGDRNGLRNLRMRAEEMRARFELRSRNGEGTQAWIRVPLSA
jgi:signal transduction histidine kinase